MSIKKFGLDPNVAKARNVPVSKSDFFTFKISIILIDKKTTGSVR